MKKLPLLFLSCMALSATAQNSLLQNPTTGNIPTGEINNICMVTNGTQVVLVAAGSNAIYAIDIADKNTAEATANLVTTIPNFVIDKLNPVVGQNVQVLDMDVNPLSKSVYVLASSGTQRFIVKIRNNGANISLVSLNNISHSKLTWGGQGMSVNDMAFGNNTLYVSSGSFQLDGEVGWVAPPFANNATFTKRATTMFKSNWGGQYSTTAPLETLAFGKIDNKNRLMGVTTCAPGFSFDAATLQGTGVLSVTEDFNVEMGFSKKVAFMSHDNNSFLFDLHDERLYRIGKKYLDGSRVAASNHNNNADKLRDMMGNIPNTYTATEMKQMSTTTYNMMAKWDEYRLLLLESGSTGKLILSQMSLENPPPPPPPTNIVDLTSAGMEMYPNPAKGYVVLSLPEGKLNATVKLVSVSGRIARIYNINKATTNLNIGNISPGIYTIVVNIENGQQISQKLTIE